MGTNEFCPFCHAQTLIQEKTYRRYACGTDIDARGNTRHYNKKCSPEFVQRAVKRGDLH